MKLHKLLKCRRILFIVCPFYFSLWLFFIINWIISLLLLFVLVSFLLLFFWYHSLRCITCSYADQSSFFVVCNLFKKMSRLGFKPICRTSNDVTSESYHGLFLELNWFNVASNITWLACEDGRIFILLHYFLSRNQIFNMFK